LVAASTMMLFSIAILITRQVESGTVQRLQITRMTALDMLGGISILYIIISLVTVALSFWTAQALGFISQGPLWVGILICASTALGYGSCWLEGYTLPREKEFKKLLGVPKDKRLLTLVPIGVPVEWPTVEKKSLEEVIHWERY
jgi:hypothetical protein